MSVLVAIITLALVVGVALLISAPLRAAPRRERRGGESAALAELEAARVAKYREIRDAELDYRTGKLSRDDYEAIDTALRAEAIEILRRLDAARS